MRRGFLLLGLLVPVACDDLPTEPAAPEPPPAQLVELWRDWGYLAHELAGEGTEDGGYEQASGVVHHSRAFDRASGEVYSNDTGATYWLRAAAPATVRADSSTVVGITTVLAHTYRFRKTSPDAQLRFTITGVALDALDGNPLCRPLSTAPACWEEPTCATARLSPTRGSSSHSSSGRRRTATRSRSAAWNSAMPASSE